MTNLKDQMATDSEATPEVDEGALSTLMSLAEEMERLKEIIDEQDQELKDLRKRYDEVRKVLIPEEMERVKLVNASGKGSFTLSSGAKIHLASDMYAGYLKANEASAFEWLRGEGHGDLIKLTIHPSTLKAFAKEQLADGHPLPEALFNTTPFTFAKLIRRKS